MRGRILDAARELFATQGYDAVTLRKVADCIEYCPATIYKYLKDKEEMVRALVSQDIAAMMDAFRPSMAMQTPLLPGDDPMYQEKQNDPQMDSYGLFLSVIQECVDAGLFRPQYRDAESIAQTLWAGLHGVISLHIALGDEGAIDWRPVRERAVAMLELIMNGLLADTFHAKLAPETSMAASDMTASTHPNAIELRSSTNDVGELLCVATGADVCEIHMDEGTDVEVTSPQSSWLATGQE